MIQAWNNSLILFQKDQNKFEIINFVNFFLLIYQVVNNLLKARCYQEQTKSLVRMDIHSDLGEFQGEFGGEGVVVIVKGRYLYSVFLN